MSFPGEDLAEDISDLFEDGKIPDFESDLDSDAVDGVGNPYKMITKKFQRMNFASHVVKAPAESQVDGTVSTKVAPGMVVKKFKLYEKERMRERNNLN